jgi:hypothetical protein
MAEKRRTAAFTLLILWVALALVRPVPARGAGLDGTQWKMRFRSAKAWLHIWKADIMRFADGKFDDTECGSYGFSEASYGLTDTGGRPVWRATRYNPDGERTDWEGVLEGDTMEGTFTWTRPDGQSRKYTFSAKRRGNRVAAAKG